TSDSGYIISGNTKHYGNNTPANDNAWLIKDDTSWGEVVSTDLTECKNAGPINDFTCDVEEPFGTTIKVQFSNDANAWYNSTGSQNCWDSLSHGSNIINLTKLRWNGSHFYYRINLACDGIDTPVLKHINLSYHQYVPPGKFESQSHYSGGNVSWRTINWNATTPPSTELRFQLRTADSEGGLTSKNYLGSDGTPSTNYTLSGTEIWSGHGSERYIQFIAYLNTTNISVSPIIHNVTIIYNLIPEAPGLTAPANNSWTADTTPLFDWDFYDLDGTQGAFRLQVADDPTFTSIQYDSGVVSSAVSSHAPTVDIPNGTWYWKVRTRDNDGNLSLYSGYRIISIDRAPPRAFKPTANPLGWTTDDTPTISFTTIDDGVGMDSYWISIDNNTFLEKTSPYTLPAQPDGSHNITVRAVDSLGNYLDRWVDVYIDTSPPNSFTPTGNHTSWTNESHTWINFATTDDHSGMNRFEVDVDGGGFSTQTSPYKMSALADGTYNVTVRAYDNVGKYIDRYVDIYIDSVKPGSFTPIANPADWSNNTRPTVEFTTTDDRSGIDFYEVQIGSGTFEPHVSPYELPSLADGTYTITVRAWDKAANYRDGTVTVKVDTLKPDGLQPTVDPSGWTSNPQPILTFGANDGGSGIHHYEVKVGAGGTFEEKISPYTLPVMADGIHNITVRAIDNANNYIDRYVDVYIDTRKPENFKPTTTISGWQSNSQPVISFETTDTPSGISHYQVRIGSGNFVNQTNPYTLPVLSDGAYNITVRAFDYALNYIDRYVDVYIDTKTPSITHTPVTLGNNLNPITITATVTDTHSGVDYVELYYRKTIDIPFSKVTMTKVGGSYSGDIPVEALTADGVEYYIKASDKSTPANVIYYCAAGEIVTEPNDYNVIPITITEEDITAPTVIEKSPEGNDVPVNTEIYVVFNEEMDTSIKDLITLSPEVSGTSRWEGTSKFIFQPDFALEYTTQYAVSVKTTARDLAGNYLADEYKWQFMTTSVQDTTSPKVIDWMPTGTDVPIDTTISIEFSEPMKKTETEGAFTITPAVDVTPSWTGNTLILTPTSPLAYETEYRVNVTTQAKDLVGNLLDKAHSWKFSTEEEPRVDIEYPEVKYWQPDGLKEPIDNTKTIIEVQFTQPMDKDLDPLTYFSISPKIGVIAKWEGEALTFTPVEPLEYSTVYNITINTSAVSEAGLHLENDFRWSFKTEDKPEGKGDVTESTWDKIEPIVTAVTILASAIAFLIGFISIRRKRGKLRKYLDKIDETYNDYKNNPKVCEKELRELRESIKADVKKGEIEENHFLILDKKIDDYIEDVKSAKEEPKKPVGKGRGGLPPKERPKKVEAEEPKKPKREMPKRPKREEPKKVEEKEELGDEDIDIDDLFSDD
ncbi:MAG: Ig-like domain-containing protein, partial [Thermoplasmata archaeon]